MLRRDRALDRRAIYLIDAEDPCVRLRDLRLDLRLLQYLGRQHGPAVPPIGRRCDYLYGERVDMLLSLFANTPLARQVFAATLPPA